MFNIFKFEFNKIFRFFFGESFSSLDDKENNLSNIEFIFSKIFKFESTYSQGKIITNNNPQRTIDLKEGKFIVILYQISSIANLPFLLSSFNIYFIN